jgi:hypothetical protein
LERGPRLPNPGKEGDRSRGVALYQSGKRAQDSIRLAEGSDPTLGSEDRVKNGLAKFFGKPCSKVADSGMGAKYGLP